MEETVVFSSIPFLLIFLPVTVFGFYLLKRVNSKLSLPYLFLMSLFFYGYWEPVNTWIIILAIIFNFYWAHLLYSLKSYRKTLLITGLLVNLAPLVYFKYSNFIISNVNALFSCSYPLAELVLPIGISFFTFQQIAFLVDVYSRKHDAQYDGLLHYGLFVSFFPQLIAGPIVHHSEMMPQFSKKVARIDWETIYTGFFYLTIGLAQKVLIADRLSPVVSYTFDEAAKLTSTEAFLGMLAYTFQLYFDFSGYSDMAIGCALFFGIRLPVNFASPYQAINIQDFWRRWHITLSRWLRDYLYIPLGGSRHGANRTALSLLATFLIGGLWHGAAWTFVLWGAMHGLALVAHRAWNTLDILRLPKRLSWFLTFLFVNIAWIIFRASNTKQAFSYLQSLFAFESFSITKNFSESIKREMFIGSSMQLCFFLMLAFVLACFAKNSLQLEKYKTTPAVTVLIPAILVYSLAILSMSDIATEFLYFQF